MIQKHYQTATRLETLLACICENNPVFGYARNRRRVAGFLPLAGILLTMLLGACGGTAEMAAYRHGDYDEALREFKDEGDPEGNFALGVMHYKGEGVARDPDEAVAWFHRAADNGHAGAQYNLGLLYLRGEGVQKDRREAAHWFRLAAGRDMSRPRNIWGSCMPGVTGWRKI